MSRFRFTIVLLFSLCGLPHISLGLPRPADSSCATARRKTVQAHGQAQIVKGNAPLAEAQAAASAYRHAVEQIVLSLGGPKAGGDALIDQLLYDRAASFVANSALIERSTSGTLLNLELQVEVEFDAVQSVLIERSRAPRIRDRAKAKAKAALPGASWVLRGPLPSAMRPRDRAVL